LCQRQEEFEQLNTRVVIISFGTLPALQAWMKETCITFDVLLDPDRAVYRAYELEESRWRSWSPKTLLTYARLLLSGRKWLPKEGDTSQMGGDFIIEPQGNIKLAYRSKEPADRPAVNHLLEILKQIER
jgi:peroxiredoxin